MMEKKVFVYYTGGTIGMVLDDDGELTPGKPGDFTKEIKRHPELFAKEESGWFVLPRKATDDCPTHFNVKYRIEEVEKPIDSTMMLPKNWCDIVDKIKEHAASYDGFVILHGTDTMAYTSSALSFLMKNFCKPVVLTGAQRTLFEPRSDAVDNILGSLLVAGCYSDNKSLQKISLFFDNKLFQGNRVTKVDSNSFEAFTSPKFKPLMTMGVDIKVIHTDRSDSCDLCIVPYRQLCNDTSDARLIYLYPGIQENFVSSALQNAGGVVLASFGSGNVPNFEWLINAVTKASERGVLFLNCSQVLKGVVEPIYDVSSWMVKAGVISGNDITPEAALTKMIWVLQIPVRVDEKKELLKKNICGEMTVLKKN